MFKGLIKMSRKGLSVSAALAGDKTNLAHNNREEKEVRKKKNDHIDKEKINDNVYLKQESIEEVFDKIFGDALEKYNNKQTRNDRKIPNYYEHIKNSKREIEQRELIIQVGSLLDIENEDMDPEEAKEMLIEWYEGFQERNPNLVVYNAVIHMDEATPHLHLNFIPVGRNYKRGMEKQVGFNRALIQQDESFDERKPFTDWRDKEVKVMEEIMSLRGIERKEVGTHASMSVDRFKQLIDGERALEKDKKEFRKTKEDFKKKIVGVNKAVKDVNMVTEQQRLKELEQKEKDKEQLKKEKELKDKEKALKDRETSLNEKEDTLKVIRDGLSSKNEVLKLKEVDIDSKGDDLVDGLNIMVENAHIPEVRERLEEMKEEAPLEIKEFERLILTEEDIKDLSEEDNLHL